MQTVTINQRVLPAVGLGTWHMGDDPAKRTMAGPSVWLPKPSSRLIGKTCLSLTRSCHSTRATRSWSRVWIAV